MAGKGLLNERREEIDVIQEQGAAGGRSGEMSGERVRAIQLLGVQEGEWARG